MCCTHKTSSFILYCVLGLKYGFHLFVNQKLKKTIKLHQLQRHVHKLSLTSASNWHSFHLAFEISNASNKHKSMNAQRHEWATKLTCSPFYSTQPMYKLYRSKSDGGLLTAVKQTRSRTETQLMSFLMQEALSGFVLPHFASGHLLNCICSTVQSFPEHSLTIV